MWTTCTCAAIAAFTVACGDSRPPAPLTGMHVEVSTVEWRAQASDDQHVDVSIVVDRAVQKLASVEATPDLCAIRSASAKITELLCGNESFVAEVGDGELVVTHGPIRSGPGSAGHAGQDVRHIEIGRSVAITVAPYRY